MKHILFKMPILLKNLSVHKYEPFIQEYLSARGEVSLEKLGVFRLTKEKIVPESNEFVAPYLINFMYDRKAVTSEPLIEFIAEQEKKNKLLVAFDIESYLEEVRQFVNIGKSFTIEGLGSLTMNKQHEIEFLQETKLESKEGSDQSRRKRADTYSGYERKSNQPARGSKVGLLVIFIVLVILAGIGGTVYYRFFKNDDHSVPDAAKDASADSGSQPDTLQKTAITPENTALPKQTGSVADSFLVKFIFEVTSDKLRAYNRIAQLREFGDPAALDSIRTDTGYVYKLYVKQKILKADTTKAKDSVQLYFQKPVELQVTQ